eukprot:TRINITY_DN5196_c0_g1_i1.p2 TRINITY_DN5196_c0_g1~~TRINITY_DN5196_c0_g1_i1.p2  ORF type:complete len:191 (-),score=7.93 TRINITY_DN5196_c0_g1_i1:385-957(-)
MKSGLVVKHGMDQAHQFVTNGGKWHMKQWIENKVSVKVPLPQKSVYNIWEDRTSSQNFMEWVSSIEIIDDTLSRWRLSTYQFNRQWEITWLARNLTSVPYSKIHWESVSGSSDSSFGAFEVPNTGQVRIYPIGANECEVELSIQYQVIDVLAPFATALSPLVDFILQRDMRKFVDYALKLENDKLQQVAQ